MALFFSLCLTLLRIAIKTTRIVQDLLMDLHNAVEWMERNRNNPISESPEDQPRDAPETSSCEQEATEKIQIDAEYVPQTAAEVRRLNSPIDQDIDTLGLGLDEMSKEEVSETETTSVGACFVRPTTEVSRLSSSIGQEMVILSRELDELPKVVSKTDTISVEGCLTDIVSVSSCKSDAPTTKGNIRQISEDVNSDEISKDEGKASEIETTSTESCSLTEIPLPSIDKISLWRDTENDDRRIGERFLRYLNNPISKSGEALTSIESNVKNLLDSSELLLFGHDRPAESDSRHPRKDEIYKRVTHFLKQNTGDSDDSIQKRATREASLLVSDGDSSKQKDLELLLEVLRQKLEENKTKTSDFERSDVMKPLDISKSQNNEDICAIQKAPEAEFPKPLNKPSEGMPFLAETVSSNLSPSIDVIINQIVDFALPRINKSPKSKKELSIGDINLNVSMPLAFNQMPISHDSQNATKLSILNMKETKSRCIPRRDEMQTTSDSEILTSEIGFQTCVPSNKLETDMYEMPEISTNKQLFLSKESSYYMDQHIEKNLYLSEYDTSAITEKRDSKIPSLPDVNILKPKRKSGVEATKFSNTQVGSSPSKLSSKTADESPKKSPVNDASDVSLSLPRFSVDSSTGNVEWKNDAHVSSKSKRKSPYKKDNQSTTLKDSMPRNEREFVPTNISGRIVPSDKIRANIEQEFEDIPNEVSSSEDIQHKSAMDYLPTPPLPPANTSESSTDTEKSELITSIQFSEPTGEIEFKPTRERRPTPAAMFLPKPPTVVDEDNSAFPFSKQLDVDELMPPRERRLTPAVVFHMIPGTSSESESGIYSEPNNNQQIVPSVASNFGLQRPSVKSNENTTHDEIQKKLSPKRKDSVVERLEYYEQVIQPTRDLVPVPIDRVQTPESTDSETAENANYIRHSYDFLDKEGNNYSSTEEIPASGSSGTDGHENKKLINVTQISKSPSNTEKSNVKDSKTPIDTFKVSYLKSRRDAYKTEPRSVRKPKNDTSTSEEEYDSKTSKKRVASPGKFHKSPKKVSDVTSKSKGFTFSPHKTFCEKKRVTKETCESNKYSARSINFEFGPKSKLERGANVSTFQRENETKHDTEKHATDKRARSSAESNVSNSDSSGATEYPNTNTEHNPQNVTESTVLKTGSAEYTKICIESAIKVIEDRGKELSHEDFPQFAKETLVNTEIAVYYDSERDSTVESPDIDVTTELSKSLVNTGTDNEVIDGSVSEGIAGVFSLPKDSPCRTAVPESTSDSLPTSSEDDSQSKDIEDSNTSESIHENVLINEKDSAYKAENSSFLESISNKSHEKQDHDLETSANTESSADILDSNIRSPDVLGSITDFEMRNEEHFSRNTGSSESNSIKTEFSSEETANDASGSDSSNEVNVQIQPEDSQESKDKSLERIIETDFTTANGASQSLHNTKSSNFGNNKESLTESSRSDTASTGDLKSEEANDSSPVNSNLVREYQILESSQNVVVGTSERDPPGNSLVTVARLSPVYEVSENGTSSCTHSDSDIANEYSIPIETLNEEGEVVMEQNSCPGSLSPKNGKENFESDATIMSMNRRLSHGQLDQRATSDSPTGRSLNVEKDNEISSESDTMSYLSSIKSHYEDVGNLGVSAGLNTQCHPLSTNIMEFDVNRDYFSPVLEELLHRFKSKDENGSAISEECTSIELGSQVNPVPETSLQQIEVVQLAVSNFVQSSQELNESSTNFDSSYLIVECNKLSGALEVKELGQDLVAEDSIDTSKAPDFSKTDSKQLKEKDGNLSLVQMSSQIADVTDCQESLTDEQVSHSVAQELTDASLILVNPDKVIENTPSLNSKDSSQVIDEVATDKKLKDELEDVTHSNAEESLDISQVTDDATDSKETASENKPWRKKQRKSKKKRKH